MPLSTDVTLPRQVTPKFPNDCVVCDAPFPSSHVSMGAATSTWWSWITFLPGSYFVVKAPACPSCAWRLYGSRWLGYMVFVCAIGVLCWLFYPYLQGIVPRIVQKYAMLILILLIFAPVYILKVYFPPVFEITVNPNTIDYAFRDADYAMRFYGLNADHVVKTDINSHFAAGAKAVHSLHTPIWPGPAKNPSNQHE